MKKEKNKSGSNVKNKIKKGKSSKIPQDRKYKLAG